MSDLNANEWNLHEVPSYRIAVGSKKARIQILLYTWLILCAVRMLPDAVGIGKCISMRDEANIHCLPEHTVCARVP